VLLPFERGIDMIGADGDGKPFASPCASLPTWSRESRRLHAAIPSGASFCALQVGIPGQILR
jgi:hypothetical protein